jgi:hypothetical protein
MTRNIRSSGRFSVWLPLLLVPALTMAPARPALATEALGDLEVHARLLDDAPSKTSRPAGTTGAARIEVVVQARVPVSDLRVRILRPDGTPWTVASLPFHSGRPAWSRVGEGVPTELDAGAPSLGPRESALTVLRVPLERAGIHEIVVLVEADGPGGLLLGEDVVLAPLGVSLPRPEDDGTSVTFRLEVRP